MPDILSHGREYSWFPADTYMTSSRGQLRLHSGTQDIKRGNTRIGMLNTSLSSDPLASTRVRVLELPQLFCCDYGVELVNSEGWS
jgi:hypothetical protein